MKITAFTAISLLAISSNAAVIPADQHYDSTPVFAKRSYQDRRRSSVVEGFEVTIDNGHLEDTTIHETDDLEEDLDKYFDMVNKGRVL
ncbi:hypothetical protein BASA50_010642 [Batrachochytrium salamandrivorans]|uniref:Uncharacterized protein n=1 Tax=Batrachochytrium salamandrivorans TaxID=1357716 RepID=A0ABQ8EXZ4_9FUNG|nr:hypothetical protein BASA62_004322 [Batrachochytrium salamandrivorans]KAH6576184.1 hypothetical protein BASA60_004652 [Batrachochytrium salamandrivorans]KAH6588572.1 hypothetical protein BASA50_010642 [Batrachochytrium salamandrivorans]KAH6588853.1 hypothetical protein BASA61_005806 [Batrachochytrium salamandrivorans]KAH9251610.1 hypothetical protein BASA81_010519 [Batrachochytrium salamandrivorans]